MTSHVQAPSTVRTLPTVVCDGWTPKVMICMRGIQYYKPQNIVGGMA